MKKLLLWFLLLNKRLYKKFSYLAILLLIPVMVIAFREASKEPGGVVSVALANENSQDTLAVQMITELKSNPSVISFQEVSPEQAKQLVATGKVDSAWIFPADLRQRIVSYIKQEKGSQGFISVIEREDSIPLKLACEKLSSVLHKQTVKETYLQYIREVAPETAQIPDAELLAFLKKTDVSGQLFDFYDIEGNRREKTTNFLTAPLRGLLAVLTVIYAVVTAMYYQTDLKRGVFSLLPEWKRFWVECGYQMISAVNILVFIMIGLFCSGLNAAFWKEILIFLLFSVGCALFGMLLRGIVGSLRALAVLIPVLTVLMLVVCPVFFDFPIFRYVQMLLPPTYFVNCAFQNSGFIYLVIYDMILFACCFGIHWCKMKNFKL